MEALKNLPLTSYRNSLLLTLLIHASLIFLTQPEAHLESRTKENSASSKLLVNIQQQINPTPKLPSPRSQASPAPMPTPNEVSSSQEGEKRLKSYLDEIRELIEEHKFYPRIAQRLRQEGDVKVSLSIGEEGEIMALELLEASPFEILNRAALEAIESIGRFPPLPEELHTRPLNVIQKLRFKLF